MMCEDALKEIAKRKLLFGKDLVKRVIECEEAPELIVKLADELDEISDGWFSVHAIFILSIIGNDRAFEALKHIATTRDLGDFTIEDLPYLFARFEGKTGELREIAENENFDVFVRLAAFKALMHLSREDAKIVAEKLLEEVKEKKDESCVFLMYISILGGKFREESLKLAKDCKIHSKDLLTELDLRLEDPWEHFSPENLLRLYKINYGKLNFDKYAPCFCGSGKKFKFCCYEVWKGI